MTEHLDAIYKNGSFFPVGDSSISLSDGARVRLTVASIEQSSANNVLELAARVYAGLSESDIAEIERIATDRSSFFSE